MRRWEYQALEVEAPTVSIEQLNGLGAEGWRLVCVYPLREKWVYMFAREYYRSIP